MILSAASTSWNKSVLCVRFPGPTGHRRFNKPTQKLRLKSMRKGNHAVCWLSPPHTKRLAILPRLSALSARAQGNWDRVPTSSTTYH